MATGIIIVSFVVALYLFFVSSSRLALRKAQGRFQELEYELDRLEHLDRIDEKHKVYRISKLFLQIWQEKPKFAMLGSCGSVMLLETLTDEEIQQFMTEFEDRVTEYNPYVRMYLEHFAQALHYSLRKLTPYRYHGRWYYPATFWSWFFWSMVAIIIERKVAAGKAAFKTLSRLESASSSVIDFEKEARFSHLLPQT